MFDWENMRHFLAVAQAGTLSGAARALQVDHATVSRRLTALESALKLSLVERLPRSCRLTAHGQELLQHAAAMEHQAFAAERYARAQQAVVAGKVVVSAPPVLVTHFLAQHLAAFRDKHPDIQLSVLAQAHHVSLSRRQADIALRLVRPNEPTSAARRLGTLRFALYASRTYARTVAAEHRCFIAYDDSLNAMPQQHWLLARAGNRPISCELSDISSQLSAARAGAGVAGLPCFLADTDPDLIPIEEDGPGFARDIWLVVHKDVRRARPVRVVLDYLAALVAHEPALCCT
jgi:DNA-binding transcriptional LysR family regulator